MRVDSNSQNVEFSNTSKKPLIEPKVIGNYSINEVLGEGTFGKVYRGIHLKTGENVF